MRRLLGAAFMGLACSFAVPVSAATTEPPVPLSAASTSGQLVTIVTAFGQVAKPNERFFNVLSGEGRHFAVITPPGMATNGGISVSTTGVTRTAALLPSQLLTFTPLAATSSGALSWSAGVIDASVARHPDAVSSTSTRSMAVDTQGRVFAARSLDHWTAVSVSMPAWARAARCRPTAISLRDNASAPVYGLTCTRATPSVVASGSASRATGSRLERQLLRLRATDHGYVAIERVPSLGRIIIEHFSPNVRLTATTSVPLRQVSATALDDAGAVMLLGRAKNQPVVVMISEKGEVTQVRAPRNARAVALGVAGTSEVLSVVDHVKRQEASLVTVRAWESGRWKTTERFGVPVPYGSSK